MSIRFYIAPQQGTGTFEDPYRSILNDFIDVSQGESFQEIDHPARRFSICCVTAADATHTNIANDSRVIVVSRLYATKLEAVDGLEEPVNNIPGAADLKTKLEANGINTGWITGSNSLKDAIRYIFRNFFLSQIVTGQNRNAHMADIIVRNLDTTVSAIPQAVRTGVRDWMQSKGLAIGWITNQTTVREILHFIIQNLGFGFIRLMGEDF